MAINTAMSSLAGIGWGMILGILKYAGIAILCAGLFYGGRYVQKQLKKQKAFITQAIILDLNGVIEFDDLAFVKNDSSGMLEMEFKLRKNETVPPIPKHLVKNNKVVLLNYAPGHYCVIDTSETVNNLSNGIKNIIPFNLGMKKYIISKQREFLNKEETKRKNWETRAPWITLGVCFALCVVLAFLLFYFGIKLDNMNIVNRIAECGRT